MYMDIDLLGVVRLILGDHKLVRRAHGRLKLLYVTSTSVDVKDKYGMLVVRCRIGVKLKLHVFGLLCNKSTKFEHVRV